MAIGGRNPDPAGNPIFDGARIAAQADQAAAASAGGAAPVPWFARIISPTWQPVTLIDGTVVSQLVATLPAPGSGVTYAIELASVNVPAGTLGIVGGVGDVSARNAYYADASPGAFEIIAGGFYIPRCAPTEAFWIQWAGLTDPAGASARVQVRVERAAP